MGKSSATWLSQGAEVLARRLSEQQSQDFHCDVLIVGSGYGGAVAAARLAGSTVVDETGTGGQRRPARIWVLERGREHLPGSFPSRFAELPGEVRFSLQDGKPARGNLEALFDVRVGDDVNVVVGNGLGGGSLINAAVMERANETVWSEGWPDGVTLQAMSPAYAKAEAMLGLQKLPSGINHPKLQALDGVAKEMGRRAKLRRVNLAINFNGVCEPSSTEPQGVCTHCGDCVTGCNQGAKRSLDVSYLAYAHARGAEMYCGGWVETVTRAAGGAGTGWHVTWHYTAPGKRASAKKGCIRARRVILAAGSLGSTEILLRSGLPVSPRIGEGFSTNGDMIVASYRQTEQARACGDEDENPSVCPPTGRNVGPTISGLVDVPSAGEKKPAFAVTEFAIPASLRRVLGEVVTTFGLLYGLGKRDVSFHERGEPKDDPLAVLPSAIDHTAIYGLMGDDGANGKIEFPANVSEETGEGKVAVAWPEVRRHSLFTAQANAMTSAIEAAKGMAIPNPIWRPLPEFIRGVVDLPLGPVTTVHPLGGCRMSDSGRDGVVNHIGQVFAGGGPDVHADLVVLDGSIVPRALGINPALTIAALAERAIPLLADPSQWDLTLQDDGPSPDFAGRPIVDGGWSSRAGTDAGTSVHIREQLHGWIALSGESGVRKWAELEIDFADVPKLDVWLRSMDRKLQIKHATLHLFDDPGQAQAARRGHSDEQAQAPTQVMGTLSVFTREESSWDQRQDLRDEIKHRLFADSGGFLNCRANIGAAQLAGHVGEKRSMRYELELQPNARLHAIWPEIRGQMLKVWGQKNLGFNSHQGVWSKLTSVALYQGDAGDTNNHLGTLQTDLDDFVDRNHALLSVTAQRNQPEALADLAALGLLMGRLLLKTHLPMLYPLGNTRHALNERVPGPVDGITPKDLHCPGDTVMRCYSPTDVTDRRPVVLIHGYGASGTTFTHESIGIPLAAYLLRKGRPVWVLELRTSIARPPPAEPPTFDEVACDIADAIAHALDVHRDVQKVDVVAHCIGAAMFSVAVLRSETLHRAIGSVVLSQLSPLVRVTPFNRLRGHIASYFLKYLSIDALDNRPEYRRRDGGEWESVDTGVMQMLLDAVLMLWPYPPDDQEERRLERLAARRPDGKQDLGQIVDFRRVRHRTDAIFGQTMQLANVSDATLMALDAIYGPVQLKTFAQTLLYARERLLIDPDGNNRLVSDERLRERFNFPVLLLHGRRNEMFDWRGSADCHRILANAFGDHPPPHVVAYGDDPAIAHADYRQGEAGSPRQLLVLDGYGHQDTMIGARAHADVFPHLFEFLEKNKNFVPKDSIVDDPLVCEEPQVGPMLGWIRQDPGNPNHVKLSLLVHATPRYATVRDVLVVPMRVNNGADDPDMDQVHGFAHELFHQVPEDRRHQVLLDRAVNLIADPERLQNYVAFVIVTLHHNQVLPIVEPRAGDLFVNGRLIADSNVKLSLQQFLSAPDATQRRASFALGPAVLAARDRVEAAQPPPASLSLSFAVGSCQYPPGLHDLACAQASLAQLSERLRPGKESGLAKERAQFLLLVGDQVYVDDAAGLFQPPLKESQVVRNAYELVWRMPAFRDVTARLPSYPMLDDHEVRDNWQPVPGAPSTAEEVALKQYWRHQGKLSPPPTITDDYSYRFAPGGVPFFVLDTRTRRDSRSVHRSPGIGPPFPVESARIVLDDTMLELQAWLLSHKDHPAKFIVSPSVVFPLERYLGNCAAERLSLDTWSGYPRSLFDLLDFILVHRIRGVVFVSGDAHLSTFSRLTLGKQTGGRRVSVFSIVSSGWYTPWPFANSRREDLVLDGPVSIRSGTFVLPGEMSTAAVSEDAGYASVRLHCVPEQPARLVVEFVSNTGSVNHGSYALNEGETR